MNHRDTLHIGARPMGALDNITSEMPSGFGRINVLDYMGIELYPNKVCLFAMIDYPFSYCT